jgi:hypothetical protein
MALLCIRVSVILIFGFVGGSLAMVTLGGMQSSHSGLDGFVEGCEGLPQPCWYGIVPHVTTLNDAEMILEHANYTFDQSGALRDSYDYVDFRRPIQEGQCSAITLIYGYNLQDVLVEGMVLQLCQDLYIGDILEIVDEPINRIFISPTGVGFIEVNDSQILISFQWSGNVNPYSEVRHIDLEPAYVYGVPPLAAWSGYAPLWRYCQLQPNYLFCD